MSSPSIKLSTCATVILFSVLMMSSVLLVNADADFSIIRPVFDQVIEEGGGVNYIRIHRREAGYDIWNARPKLGLYRSLDVNRTMTAAEREEWTNKFMSIREREGKIKEVRQEFLEALPELERSAGLRFWSTIIMVDRSRRPST